MTSLPSSYFTLQVRLTYTILPILFNTFDLSFLFSTIFMTDELLRHEISCPKGISSSNITSGKSGLQLFTTQGFYHIDILVSTQLSDSLILISLQPSLTIDKLFFKGNTSYSILLFFYPTTFCLRKIFDAKIIIILFVFSCVSICILCTGTVDLKPYRWLVSRPPTY